MTTRSTAVDGTGLRMTSQRRALLHVLRDLPGPTTAYAIHRRLRDGGERIGLTTTYRHLASLVRAEVMGTTQDRAGRHLYYLKRDSDHNHHLTCVRCGQGVRVDASAVVEWATSTAALHGFSTVQVSADLTGLCPRCRAEQVAPPDDPGPDGERSRTGRDLSVSRPFDGHSSPRR
jgi:Fur family ferric uptake transcriptional regulator